MADWEEWRRSPEGYLETGITELFLLAMRSEDELTDAAVARLHGIGAVLEDAAANLDPLPGQPADHRAQPGRVHGQHRLRPPEVVELADRARQPGDSWPRPARSGPGPMRPSPATCGELAPRCTGTYVFGEDHYNEVLRKGELLDTDDRALRQQGWDEYHRVAEQMAEVAAKVPGGSSDWAAVIRRLQQVHPSSVDGMRAEYEAVCLQARRFMIDQGLVTDPPDERCHVVPAPPAMRATLAVACYIAPPMFKPSREGYFFVPYPVDGEDAEEVQGLLESNATYSMATTRCTRPTPATTGTS